MQKSDLRRLFSEKRAAIMPAEHALWSGQCCTHLVHYIRSLPGQPSVIAGYAPINAELDIMPALYALATFYSLVLPAIVPDSRILLFKPWKPGDALIHGTFGTREPVRTPPEQAPDLLIVPLLAYGNKGERLGYGKGYYDATLAQLGARTKTIGVAFSLQHCPDIPTAAHDIALNTVITDQGVNSFFMD